MREMTTTIDIDLARRALGHANLNALRVALYQATGDSDLAAMGTRKEPLRGGAFFRTTLDEPHHEAVQERALGYLAANLGRPWAPAPAKEEAVRLMRVFVGRPWDEATKTMGYEELAFDDFPRAATWSAEPPAGRLSNFLVVIIGAGLSGIAAAVQLRRLGIPFILVDRQSGVGGTWQRNWPDPEN
jgi:4-hydroxyacetophenone monooxygenase